MQTHFVILKHSNFFQNSAFTAEPAPFFTLCKKARNIAEWEYYQWYMANVYCYCIQYFSQAALNSLCPQFKVLRKTREWVKMNFLKVEEKVDVGKKEDF